MKQRGLGTKIRKRFWAHRQAMGDREGQATVGGTLRPDGSRRPERRIRKGFVNPEKLKKYVIPSRRLDGSGGDGDIPSSHRRLGPSAGEAGSAAARRGRGGVVAAAAAPPRPSNTADAISNPDSDRGGKEDKIGAVDSAMSSVQVLLCCRGHRNPAPASPSPRLLADSEAPTAAAHDLGHTPVDSGAATFAAPRIPGNAGEMEGLRGNTGVWEHPPLVLVLQHPTTAAVTLPTLQTTPPNSSDATRDSPPASTNASDSPPHPRGALTPMERLPTPPTLLASLAHSVSTILTHEHPSDLAAATAAEWVLAEGAPVLILPFADRARFRAVAAAPIREGGWGAGAVDLGTPVDRQPLQRRVFLLTLTVSPPPPSPATPEASRAASGGGIPATSVRPASHGDDTVAVAECPTTATLTLHHTAPTTDRDTAGPDNTDSEATWGSTHPPHWFTRADVEAAATARRHRAESPPRGRVTPHPRSARGDGAQGNSERFGECSPLLALAGLARRNPPLLALIESELHLWWSSRHAIDHATHKSGAHIAVPTSTASGAGRTTAGGACDSRWGAVGRENTGAGADEGGAEMGDIVQVDTRRVEQTGLLRDLPPPLMPPRSHNVVTTTRLALFLPPSGLHQSPRPDPTTSVSPSDRPAQRSTPASHPQPPLTPDQSSGYSRDACAHSMSGNAPDLTRDTREKPSQPSSGGLGLEHLPTGDGVGVGSVVAVRLALRATLPCGSEAWLCDGGGESGRVANSFAPVPRHLQSGHPSPQANLSALAQLACAAFEERAGTQGTVGAHADTTNTVNTPAESDSGTCGVTQSPDGTVHFHGVPVIPAQLIDASLVFEADAGCVDSVDALAARFLGRPPQNHRDVAKGLMADEPMASAVPGVVSHEASMSTSWMGGWGVGASAISGMTVVVCPAVPNEGRRAERWLQRWFRLIDPTPTQGKIFIETALRLMSPPWGLDPILLREWLRERVTWHCAAPGPFFPGTVSRETLLRGPIGHCVVSSDVSKGAAASTGTALSKGVASSRGNAADTARTAGAGQPDTHQARWSEQSPPEHQHRGAVPITGGHRGRGGGPTQRNRSGGRDGGRGGAGGGLQEERGHHRGGVGGGRGQHRGEQAVQADHRRDRRQGQRRDAEGAGANYRGSMQAAPLCRFFRWPNGCRNGDTCRFRHG